jgi:ABC-type transporter Mla MlaB component
MEELFTYVDSTEHLDIMLSSVKDLQEGILLKLLESNNIFYKKIQKVSINFQNINELNSLTISELINLKNRFKKINPKIEIYLINVKPEVYNIMQLVNVDEYFKILLNPDIT